MRSFDASSVRELLEVEHDQYCAVLSEPKGCANSGALAQQVLTHMQRRHGGRFRYADCTNVERIILADDRAEVHAGGPTVNAEHVVLCTNGFVDHVVQDVNGAPVKLASDQRIVGRIAHMAAFVEDAPRPPTALSYIRNTVIGGDVPYVYVTRRTYDRAGRDGHADLHGRTGVRLPASPTTTARRRSPARCWRCSTPRCARSRSPAARPGGPMTSTGTA